MTRNRDDLLRQIKQGEEKLRQMQIRQAMLSHEAWSGFRAGFIEELHGLESDLLMPRAKELTPYEIGLRQGKRQIILAMLFDEETTLQAVQQVTEHLQGLRQQLQEWDTRSWQPGP